MNYVISYSINESMLEKYLLDKGFIVKTCRRFLIQTGLNDYKKLLSEACARVKFAYLPEEENEFITRFINNIKDRFMDGKCFDDEGKCSFFYASYLSNGYIGDYILDIRARRLIKENFQNFLNNHYNEPIRLR